MKAAASLSAADRPRHFKVTARVLRRGPRQSKNEERFLSTRADRSLRNEREEKVGPPARNDTRVIGDGPGQDNTSMTLRIIRGTEAEELARNGGFQSQWEKLYEACPWGTGCQTPGFVNAWHEAYRERYERLVVAEFSTTDDLTGLLSLARQKGSGKLFAAGAHQGEYKTWLALPSNGDAFIEAAFAELPREPGVSTLVLKYLPQGTPMGWSSRKQNGWSYDLEQVPR